MSATPSPAPLGRRETRRLQTRRAVIESADRLFRERGFDNVTVAEIAAGAGVSVKTLFQHFRSKEDLLFAEEEQTRERIVAAIRVRGPEQSPLDAVVGWLMAESAADPEDDGVESYHRSLGGSPAVASRLRRLWEDLEAEVARALADERNQAVPTPLTRLEAAELAALVRLTASEEVREFVARYPSGDSVSAIHAWIQEGAAAIRSGFGGDR